MNECIDCGCGRLMSAHAEIYAAACETNTAHIAMRPRIYIDGDQWCALYGENVQDGIAGFGKSPYEAMMDFDRSYFGKLDENYPPAKKPIRYDECNHEYVDGLDPEYLKWKICGWLK